MPPSLTTFTDDALLALDTLAGRAAGLVNPSVRLGVTGLSRAGKTVFISSLVHNLLNGGRLPIGLHTTGTGGTARVSYADADRLTVWVEPRTGRVLDLRWSETVTATVVAQVGALPLDAPIAAGATPREQVVTAGQYRLQQGTLVKPKPTASKSTAATTTSETASVAP